MYLSPGQMTLYQSKFCREREQSIYKEIYFKELANMIVGTGLNSIRQGSSTLETQAGVDVAILKQNFSSSFHLKFSH